MIWGFLHPSEAAAQLEKELQENTEKAPMWIEAGLKIDQPNPSLDKFYVECRNIIDEFESTRRPLMLANDFLLGDLAVKGRLSAT